jgi:hypothetical protein
MTGTDIVLAVFVTIMFLLVSFFLFCCMHIAVMIIIISSFPHSCLHVIFSTSKPATENTRRDGILRLPSTEEGEWLANDMADCWVCLYCN